MFERQIAERVIAAASAFYAISLVGPRQSGKTTLLKQLFPQHTYLNLEDPDILERIKADPRGFFQDPQKKWIIDEAQEYPALFSYLLGFIDTNKVMGQYILSGSQNFALLENISQSLAGRVAVLELLPLTYAELSTQPDFADLNIWDMIYRGSYPGPNYTHTETALWYKSYVATYLQRDVRQLIKVKDLSKFHLFLRMCAGRHGQILNLSELGAACGVSHTTVAQWINLLELSYIVFRLQPYHKNYNKRLVKQPKLYFYDAGLVCHLLGIESGGHAQIHAARGALFEGYVISEVVKRLYAQAKTPQIYFWHANKSVEVDLLIEQGGILSAIEIKSSATYAKSFTKQIRAWQKISTEEQHCTYSVVYAGNESFSAEDINIVSYREIQTLV